MAASPTLQPLQQAKLVLLGEMVRLLQCRMLPHTLEHLHFLHVLCLKHRCCTCLFHSVHSL